MLVKDEMSGRLLPAKQKEFIDHLYKVKLDKDKSHWDVIEIIVDYWKKTNPKEYASMLVDIKETKRTRGASTGRGKGGMRYLADIPMGVYKMVQIVYGGDIEFNREFFRTFAKRFPEFKVAEKI